MENSCRCDLCNIDVHRASYAKHLRSTKPFENMKKEEMIIPDFIKCEICNVDVYCYAKHFRSKNIWKMRYEIQ